MLKVLSEPSEISLKKLKKQVGLKSSGMLRKVLYKPFSKKTKKPKTTSDSHFGFGFFGVEPPPPKMTVTFDDTPGRKVAVLGHFFKQRQILVTFFTSRSLFGHFWSLLVTF